MEGHSENTNNFFKNKKSFSSESVVAAAAILISMVSLIVYIYQTKIMQSQQHTSVWPYLEWTMAYSTIDGIYLVVTNKGVGPAIVKSTKLSLDGQPVKSARELMRKITNGKSDSIYSFIVTVDKRVISPGEELRLFHMKDSSLRHMDLGDLNKRIGYTICYCSIYGDCWASTGLDVKPAECQ